MDPDNSGAKRQTAALCLEGDKFRATGCEPARGKGHDPSSLPCMIRRHVAWFRVEASVGESSG